MPEILDLEAIRGFLDEHLEGRVLEHVEADVPWLIRNAEGLNSLVGCRFASVRRLGKFLILESDDGRLLVVNPMLTGRFTWARSSERRRSGTCLALSFGGGHQLRYSDARRMGRWYLVGAQELESVPQIA